MICNGLENEDINECDVEVCLELARMYDTEDLTHPPFRMVDEYMDELEKEEIE